MTFLRDALSAPALDLPLEGHWLYPEYPDRVTIAGFPFRKARWRQPYPGVLAQYREECPHSSMHLKVVPDGERLYWIIDHADAFNPDRGKPIGHFFVDYEPGRIVKPAALALTSVLLTKLLVPFL